LTHAEHDRQRKVVEVVGNKVAASYTAAIRAPVTGDVAVKF
jgi:hypothetical protein